VKTFSFGQDTREMHENVCVVEARFFCSYLEPSNLDPWTLVFIMREIILIGINTNSSRELRECIAFSKDEA